MSRQSELAALGRVADTSALSNRNLIINGAMQVHQRGGSVTGASGFNVDRWKQERGTLEGAMSQGTVASGTEPYVKGFRKTLKVTTSNTSTAGTHYYQAVHYFEGQNLNRSGWDYSGSGSLILSFWVKASVAGTYGFFLEDDGTPERIAGSYTLTANTWKYVTKVIPASSSLTIPDDNTRGMRIVFGISYGSDYVSASGAEEDVWADYDNTAYFNQDHSLSSTSGSTWEITGVQLEVGDTATEFEHRSYGDELARCQRYYQLNTAMSGQTYSSTALSVHTSMVTEMRAIPSIAVFDGTNAAVDVGSAIRNMTGTGGIDVSSRLGICMNLTIASTATNKYHTIRGGVISMDAEL